MPEGRGARTPRALVRECVTCWGAGGAHRAPRSRPALWAGSWDGGFLSQPMASVRTPQVSFLTSPLQTHTRDQQDSHSPGQETTWSARTPPRLGEALWRQQLKASA